MKRIKSSRALLRTALLPTALFMQSLNAGDTPPPTKPNIILMMADDLGRGDIGCYGNNVTQTPNLDTMAKEGIRFDRFYVFPFCMPTRNAIMTGQYPRRYGYQIRSPQRTMPALLRAHGYTTGHFGKWHLGKFGTTRPAAPAPDYEKPLAAYFTSVLHPWDISFDRCFTSETNVPTWNPLEVPELWRDLSRYGLKIYPWSREFWTGPGTRVDKDLSGSTDSLVTDQAVTFIRDSVARKTPFLTMLWFYAPHRPVVAGESWRHPYASLREDEQHWHGSISAMDAQVGRIRSLVKELGIAKNTILLFCSDNGPATYNERTYPRSFGTTGGLRGMKGSVYEGGICVPALMEWKGHLAAGSSTAVACAGVDYLPTVAAAAGVSLEGESEHVDGINLLPIVRHAQQQRGKPIWVEGTVHSAQATITDRYKLVAASRDTFELYDLADDRSESRNLAESIPEVFLRLIAQHQGLNAEIDRDLAQALGRRLPAR